MTWTGLAPICIRKNQTCDASYDTDHYELFLTTADVCSFLDEPRFGTISFSDDQNVGSVATYICFPGYEIEGVAERTCQADRTWTGVPPVCIRKKLS